MPQIPVLLCCPQRWWCILVGITRNPCNSHSCACDHDFFLTKTANSVSDVQKVVLVSSSLEMPVQTQQALELSAPADLDKTTTELADWLLLIDQMLKSNIVTVGNTEEINRTIARMKVCVFVKASGLENWLML